MPVAIVLISLPLEYLWMLTQKMTLIVLKIAETALSIFYCLFYYFNDHILNI